MREVLDRVDRLAVAADQHAEVVALADRAELVLTLPDRDGALHADLAHDPLHQLTQTSRVLALVLAPPETGAGFATGAADSSTLATTRAGV